MSKQGAIVRDDQAASCVRLDLSPLSRLEPHLVMLAAGAALLVTPFVIGLCRGMWSTEEGAYGPIIAITATWLIVRMTPLAAAPPDAPGRTIAVGLFGGSLFGSVLAMRTGMVGPGCVCAYAALVSVYALHYGWRAVRYAWFPFLYLLLAFPPPETITVPLGQVMKLRLSSAATDLLSALGLPVANTGVVIYVRQYELLVKTACSGLNSLIGLSAVGAFYGYVAHSGRIPLWFAPMIPAIAVLSNFVRVLVLVVAADLFGSAVVGTSFHDVVALGTYVVALLAMFAADRICTRLFRTPAPALPS